MTCRPPTFRRNPTDLVECTNPVPAISGVIFRTYPSLTALYAAYVDQVKRHSAGGKYHANINNCRVERGLWRDQLEPHLPAPEVYSLAQSESGKLTDSQAVGRVFCNFTGGLEYLVWTQNDGRLLGIVYGAPHQDVWTWWVAVHHNIGLGGVGA